jgi:pimeloyl-ACP methyl ester carboxylesterase
MPQSHNVGQGAEARQIAVLVRDGKGPPVVWLGGFKSDMQSTKGEYLDAWASRTGRALLRFDYSGHGQSGGDFEAGTISRWLDETLSVLSHCLRERPILVGSSMGGWIALLAAGACARSGRTWPCVPGRNDVDPCPDEVSGQGSRSFTPGASRGGVQ